MACIVRGCQSARWKTSGQTFFKLPKNESLAMEWLKLCCREELAIGWNSQDFRVCDQHFINEDFKTLLPRKLLQYNSKPSRNLPTSTENVAVTAFEHPSTSSGSVATGRHQRDLSSYYETTSQQDAIVVKTESAIDNINVDVTLCRGEEQKSITNELIAVDGQKYAQATPASGSVNVDLDVHIKDEPEDTDLDIGLTVLQQIDPCYRINQQNTNVLKTENTIDYDDNNTILCSRVWEESVDKCAEAEPNIFICDYCQKTFSKKFVIKVHITCVHASGSYKCNQCEKSFKCERYLKIHKAYRHTSLMKECNICGKKLRPYYVKSHVLRVHSDEKVQCKICGENMTSKHSLQHHMNNIHSQQSIDSDIYDSNSQNVKSKRRKSRSPKDWHKEQEFQCHSEADSYVQSCKIWKKCTSYKAMEGLKVTYRCTGGLYRREECPAGLRLLYHADSLKVSLFKSSCHSKHTDGTRGLKLSTREVIRKMYADGIRTPNAIIAAFRNRNMEEPKKIKLKNFLAKLRVEKFGPPTISVSKLLQ